MPICLLKINVEHDFVCLCFTVLCILYRWLQISFFLHSVLGKDLLKLLNNKNISLLQPADVTLTQ